MPVRCIVGSSSEPTGDERAWHEHGTASRSGAAPVGQRVRRTTWTRASAPLGFQVGHRLRGTLRGGVFSLLRLSVWLCAVDGQQLLALRRPHCRPVLPADGCQYPAVRRPRRQHQDVLGVAPVRLLPASRLVDQTSFGNLCVALADRRSASLHLVPLDVATTRIGKRSIIGVVRHRRPYLVQ